MENLVFACGAVSSASARQAVLLAQSLREFGGLYRNARFWVFTPSKNETISAKLGGEGVQVFPFDFPEEMSGFPFAAKVYASAAAEAAVEHSDHLLAWMDSDSLVIGEPHDLRLPENAVIGCRPVDLALIGSRFDRPVDTFWRVIYKGCDVGRDRIYPVTTTVDRVRIRAYYNAGLLLVRPKFGLLRQWAQYFDHLYHDSAIEALSLRHPRYQIFLHQAALSGVILAHLDASQVHELSRKVNYPLHLHDRYPISSRPARIEALATLRYDTYFDDPTWPEHLPAGPTLTQWLRQHIRS